MNAIQLAPPTKNMLLTGPPGCGKTAVLRRLSARLPGRRLAGFLTLEVRELVGPVRPPDDIDDAARVEEEDR